MLIPKKYIFNKETLSYEPSRKTKKSKAARAVCYVVLSLVSFAFYMWLYVDVLGFELPKTVHLKKINAEWVARIDLLNRGMDEYEDILTMLQLRDDDVYRSLFGMDPISAEVRDAGFGGVNRYAYLDGIDDSGRLKRTVRRLDILTKKTYVQSKSYDDVSLLAKRADEMASCIPQISPIVPDKSVYRISSSFGTRQDPISGRTATHLGLDFALDVGTPIYSSGDGTVITVRYSRTGYGNYIVVDHGFGYKTRYAHMSSIFAQEGDKVRRGDFLGKSGNSGKSTGPHLHYEVIYKDRPVNPINYLDLDIPVDEYSSMLRHVEAEANFALHPSHRRK